MSAKALMPNQCVPLHFLYGAQDCCLCRSHGEEAALRLRVGELEKELAGFKARQRASRKRIRTREVS